MRDVPARIVRRASLASIAVSDALAAALAAYLSTLARWNRKINLTSLELDPLADRAIDRLVVEPLAAIGYLRPDDEFVIDVGSGGGSPALPLKLAAPRLRMVLVESKIRKSAFLREAIRELRLTNIAVETARVEQLLDRGDLVRQADVITLRAVRFDRALAEAVGALLKPTGRIFAFGLGESPRAFDKRAVRTEPLVAPLQSTLHIIDAGYRRG
jgi:16S rRNA (guanine527-N7)-methyltransferase